MLKSIAAGLLIASTVAAQPANAEPRAAEAREQPLLVTPGAAPRFAGPRGRDSDITELLATGEQTGGKLGIFRQTIAPGSGPPLHLHEREVEFFYVVSGDFEFEVADQMRRVPVGTFVFVPHMTAHTFKNVGARPGVLLGGVAAGGFEKMFADRQGADAAANETLMLKYHMRVVGPPLP